MITNRGVAINSAHETIFYNINLKWVNRLLCVIQKIMQVNCGNIFVVVPDVQTCNHSTTLATHTGLCFSPAWCNSQSYLMFFRPVRISTSRGSISDLWALTTSPVVKTTRSLGRGSRQGEVALARGGSSLVFDQLADCVALGSALSELSSTCCLCSPLLTCGSNKQHPSHI